MENFEEFKTTNRDLFANHRAEITKIPFSKNCIIKFKGDSTTNFPSVEDWEITIVYIDGVITISGNYGYIMFDWGHEYTRITDYMGMDDFEYVLEHCVATDNNHYKFNSEAFKEDWNNWKNTLIKKGYPRFKVESFEKPYYIYSTDDVAYFFENFHEVDDEDKAECYSFGTRISRETYAKWYGFQQAVKDLFE